MDRRRFLASCPVGLAMMVAPFRAPLIAARAREGPLALLVPLSGPSAALGLSMQRAVGLAQASDQKGRVPATFDTAAGAAAAARLAVKRGAAMLLGPIGASDVRSVAEAVGPSVPILALSNDDSLAGSGAMLLGISAAQCCTAILGYARRRGVRRVAVLRGEGVWAEQSLRSASAIAGSLGLDVYSVASVDAAALRAGGELPDALLVADGEETFVAAGRSAAGSGVQLLGTVQATGAGAASVEGAWIAAPDPAGTAGFANDYVRRFGNGAGLIAALAYDGARIAAGFAALPRVDRQMLLQPGGFQGITGTVRFRPDGTASRDLAILVGSGGDYVVAQG